MAGRAIGLAPGVRRGGPWAGDGAADSISLQMIYLQKALQLADPGRMAHLLQSLGPDLTDSFPGDLRLFANLLEGPGISVPESET